MAVVVAEADDAPVDAAAALAAPAVPVSPSLFKSLEFEDPLLGMGVPWLLSAPLSFSTILSFLLVLLFLSVFLFLVDFSGLFSPSPYTSLGRSHNLTYLMPNEKNVFLITNPTLAYLIKFRTRNLDVHLFFFSLDIQFQSNVEFH